jgi:hypothetical protein
VPTEETKAFLHGRIIVALLPVHTSRVNSRGFNDNELDEVLNAKTSRIKKSYNRPAKNTKYDKWVTRDLRTDQRVQYP